MKTLRWAVVLLVLALAGCGSPTPDPSVNLFGEYLKDTHVEHERMGTTSGSSDDRLANFAAYYSADELPCRLLCAFKCDVSDQPSAGGANRFDVACDLPEAASGELKDLGADMDNLYARVVLAKHRDGSLDLVTVWVANSHVVDAGGGSYTSLDDFQQHNRILDSSDIFLAPRNITATSGGSQLVTMYGHAPFQWWPWAVGLIVVLLGLVGFIVFRRRRGKIV